MFDAHRPQTVLEVGQVSRLALVLRRPPFGVVTTTLAGHAQSVPSCVIRNRAQFDPDAPPTHRVTNSDRYTERSLENNAVPARLVALRPSRQICPTRANPAARAALSRYPRVPYS